MPQSTVELVADNLFRLRHARGLSQETLAAAANISRIAYDNIEKKRSSPKPATLQSLAKALHVAVGDLIAPMHRLSHVRFRSNKSLNCRDDVLWKTGRWLEVYNRVERLTTQMEPWPLGQVHAQGQALDRARNAARQARKALGLDEHSPIQNLCTLLEGHSLKVLPLSVVSSDFFGLSVGKRDGGPAIVVNVWDRITVERWIFSTAHELGHLCLHLNSFDVEQKEEPEIEEAEANVFGSEFLMPEKAFREHWESIQGLDLIDRVFYLKRLFKVSYKTILYRLSAQNRDIWTQFRELYRNRTGRLLGPADEPEQLPAEAFLALPETRPAHEPNRLSPADFVTSRFHNLVRRSVASGKMDIDEAADVLGYGDRIQELKMSWDI